MDVQSSANLLQARCTPCEGGIASFSSDAAQLQLRELPGWQLSEDATSIAKSWNCKTFIKAIDLLNQIGKLAEDEQHHPDLHLTGYRHLKVVLTTHAIGGLSANDFILAAKIDQLNSIKP